MKKIITSLMMLVVTAQLTHAQVTPEIKSWLINTTNQVGYGGAMADVQEVQYSTNNVYVNCSDIPSYTIGPWPNNPNTASEQGFLYKITRHPVKNTGTATAVGLGHTGVWTNGVSIFNVSDAQTYNGAGVWHRNAYYWEGSGFDNCHGHPQMSGEYHHHVSPTCLYNEADSTHHSPLIGFAFDGFPIYGAYAYSDSNAVSAIKRMASSYQLRNIAHRTTLPDGSMASSAGPDTSSSYPLGCFIEDYVYVAGSGDLDARNGRFCVTPDYPSGIYTYFVTIDTALKPVFPYSFFGSYYGVVQAGNTGPGSGKNTITESTTIYTPPTGVNEFNSKIKFQIEPNPVSDYATIRFNSGNGDHINVGIYTIQGQLTESMTNLQPGVNYTLNFKNYSAGIYFLHIESSRYSEVQKIVKVD